MHSDMHEIFFFPGLRWMHSSILLRYSIKIIWSNWLFVLFLFIRSFINLGFTEWNSKQTQYEVATISKLLKIAGLFAERALWKRIYSAKETCNFKEPTNRSHPIANNTVAPLRKDGLRRIHSSIYIYICICSLFDGSECHVGTSKTQVPCMCACAYS